MLATDNNYRRQAVRQQNTERERQRSQSKFRFISLRLRLTEKPTRIHFDRPEKLYKDQDSDLSFPWKRGRSHYVPGAGKSKKGAYVECGEKDCLSCALANPKAYGLEGEADPLLVKCPARAYTGLSGWVEEWYHLVSIEKKGRKDENGNPVKFNSRELCTGRGCEHCQKKRKRVFGNRFTCAFSEAQWRVLLNDVYEKVERICQCVDEDGNHGYLYPVGYVCENCETTLIDITGACPSCKSNENLSIDPAEHKALCSSCDISWSLLESEDSELSKMVSELVRCAECKHEGYPRPQMVCTTPDCAGDPHDIYHCQITLSKTGEKKETKLVVKDFKIQEPDPRLFDPQHQGEGEAAEAVVKRHKEHLNLDDVFAPDSPSVQAEKLDRPNIFRKGSGSAPAKEYKQWKGAAGKKSAPAEEEDAAEVEEETSDEDVEESED